MNDFREGDKVYPELELVRPVGEGDKFKQVDGTLIEINNFRGVYWWARFKGSESTGHDVIIATDCLPDGAILEELRRKRVKPPPMTTADVVRALDRLRSQIHATQILLNEGPWKPADECPVEIWGYPAHLLLGDFVLLDLKRL